MARHPRKTIHASSHVPKKISTKSQKNKVSTVMEEFAAGTLRSSSGEIVTDRKQALAIALSEARELKRS